MFDSWDHILHIIILVFLHIKIDKFQESSPGPEHDEIATINSVDSKSSENKSANLKEPISRAEEEPQFQEDQRRYSA